MLILNLASKYINEQWIIYLEAISYGGHIWMNGYKEFNHSLSIIQNINIPSPYLKKPCCTCIKCPWFGKLIHDIHFTRLDDCFSGRNIVPMSWLWTKEHLLVNFLTEHCKPSRSPSMTWSGRITFGGLGTSELWRLPYEYSVGFWCMIPRNGKTM